MKKFALIFVAIALLHTQTNRAHASAFVCALWMEKSSLKEKLSAIYAYACHKEEAPLNAQENNEAPEERTLHDASKTRYESFATA